ncbi:MAG: hypothetical protein ACFUZC_03465 [Chthoniobacteraceae bacterium]
MKSLPPTAQEIADVIGYDATLILARMVPTRAIYVPHKMPDSHWIVRAIGDRLATKLWEEFHGMHLPLAKCTIVATTERRVGIRKAYAAGEAVPAIAAHWGVTAQRVWQLTQDLRPMRPSKAHGKRCKETGTHETSGPQPAR